MLARAHGHPYGKTWADMFWFNTSAWDGLRGRCACRRTGYLVMTVTQGMGDRSPIEQIGPLLLR